MTENLQSCITRLKVYFHVLLTHETSCSLTTGWLASSNVFASDWSPHHLCSSSKQQKDAHSVCKSFRNSGQRCWPETCLRFAIQSGPVTKVVSAMGPRTPDELGGTISRSLYTTLVYWRMNTLLWGQIPMRFWNKLVAVHLYLSSTFGSPWSSWAASLAWHGVDPSQKPSEPQHKWIRTLPSPTIWSERPSR